MAKKKIDLQKENKDEKTNKIDHLADVKKWMEGAGRLHLYLKDLRNPNKESAFYGN